MSKLAARLTGLLWLAVLVFLAVPADWHPFVDGAFAGVAVYVALSAIVNSFFHDENRSPQ
jgi:hypothetical protein